MVAQAPVVAQDVEAGAPGPGAARPRTRYLALDAARGFALVLMVLDHAGFYAHVPVVSETYADRAFHWVGPGWFLLGLLTNLSAPTFWMLSGVSIAILSARNRRRDGHDRATARFLLVRAAALLVLEFALLPLLWTSWLHFQPMLEFDLFSALAISMLVVCVVRGWPSWALATLTAACFAGYATFTALVPYAAQTRLPLWTRPLIVYSESVKPDVGFPAFGWIGLMTLGLLLGRQLANSQWRRPRTWAIAGIVSIAFAIGLRAAGWLDPLPWRPGGSLLSFALMSKGPPSLAYHAFNLGLGMLVLAWLWRADANLERPPGRWLVVYGQASLFLFVAHLAILQITAFIAMHTLHPSEAGRYALANVLALAALVPAAAAYRKLKERHPKSLLHYL